MFLLNSRMGPFTVPPSLEDPFSLGYGAILPSSLTRFLSRALVFWLPFHLCRFWYGPLLDPQELF